MLNPKDVTIIMPHYGKTPEMEYAFTHSYGSIKQTAPDINVIVASNGLACPNKHIKKADLIISRQGQNGAVNAAVQLTTTPWIMVTNDDMIYPPGWFEMLTNVMADFSGKPLLCISPKLIEPRPGASTFDVFFAGGAGGDFDKGKFLSFAEKYSGQGMRTGFNLPFLIRRDLWDTIGGYDINYDPWGSNGDSDLEYKIKLAGVQPYQNTNAIVYHFSQTSGTFNPENHGYWEKNFAYFQEKWGFPRTDGGIWEATFMIPKGPERIFFPDWEGKYA